MAESIRISDRLYAQAKTAAALQERSLAQQVEHWARIGQASEAVMTFEFEAVNLKLKNQMVRDSKAISEGRMEQSSLMLLDSKLVNIVEVQEIDFSELHRDYN